MSDITLYDLAARDKNVRFSPFCWLAKFGLLHKGLEFETVALGFLPKSAYPDPDYGKLPILKHGDELVRDSAKILSYLEKKFPEKPLIDGVEEQKRVDRYQSWLGEALFPALGPLMFHRVATALPADEAAYFTETREERFGKTLEDLADDPLLPVKFQAALELLVPELKKSDFLGGDQPDLSDYVAASPLMWQRSITHEKICTTPPRVTKWLEKLSAHFDGYLDNIACANC